MASTLLGLLFLFVFIFFKNKTKPSWFMDLAVPLGGREVRRSERAGGASGGVWAQKGALCRGSRQGGELGCCVASRPLFTQARTDISLYESRKGGGSAGNYGGLSEPLGV